MLFFDFDQHDRPAARDGLARTVDDPGLEAFDINLDEPDVAEVEIVETAD